MTREQLLEYVRTLESTIAAAVTYRSKGRVYGFETDVVTLLKKLRRAYGELGDKKQELKSILRIVEEYESLVDIEALKYSFDYAEFLSKEGYGLLIRPGIREAVPDYEKALELYDRLVRELPASAERSIQARSAVYSISKPLLITHSLIGDRDGVIVSIRNVRLLKVTMEDEQGDTIASFTHTIASNDHRPQHLFIPRRTMWSKLYEGRFAAVLKLETDTGLKKSVNIPDSAAISNHKQREYLIMELPHLNSREHYGEACSLCHVSWADGSLLPRPRY